MPSRNLNILMLIAVWGACAQASFSQVSQPELRTRRDDAVHLVKQTRKLSKQVNALTRLTRKTIDAQSSQAQLLLSENLTESEKKKFDLEVRETMEHSNSADPRRVVASESKPVLQNYADLVARYHAALVEYLQHRQSVQQHAAAFHAAAQQDSQGQSNGQQQPAPLVIPPLSQLRVQTEDACDALQQAEASLHDSEQDLNEAIQTMMNNRKTLSAAQYAAFWTTSEDRATALQAAASAFDQNVVVKQGVIQTNMHGKMQEAMRDGDYVLSQKVYGDQHRSSALLNEEVKHATMHTQIAMLILNRLQSLSPYASSSQSNNAAGAANGDPNQFVQDDRNLAAEFAQVQALYQQVQEATPRFHQ